MTRKYSVILTVTVENTIPSTVRGGNVRQSQIFIAPKDSSLNYKGTHKLFLSFRTDNPISRILKCFGIRLPPRTVTVNKN